MNDKLKGQIRHVMSAGGWLLVLLVFLPTEYWTRAMENVKHIGTIAGAVGGIIAATAHMWSASDKNNRE